ncbi:MAG: NlpC/P60 family protein [Candidatus Babeliales bacterium]|nr:NlpC/P60 family protein [Candidatus Babeliales bacterium]
MLLKKSLIMATIINTLSGQYALVVKPVIDLLPQKMGAIYNNSNYYSRIPLSPVAKADLKTCPRVHQLLFNEIVKIVKVDNDEVVIEAPNIYYQTIDSDKKNNTFWTLKDNLIYIDKLDSNKLPKTENSNLATLLFPFEDGVTNQTYSAGTNFVYSEIPDNTNEFNIYIFDPEALEFKESKVPKKFFITKDYVNEHTKQNRIANFVNILKKWANLKHGFIPYTWGGSSFCNTSNEKQFNCVDQTYEKNKINYFEFADYQETPKAGFDCSGLIVSATRIAGIPFPFKNTTTIMKNLKQLAKNETIAEGDLIWIPGHIIIITDLKHNLCVEARGYINNGYGKVHELKLNQLFKNLNNFEDLKNAFFNKKIIQRLDSKGNVFENISNLKILKIESCWK